MVDSWLVAHALPPGITTTLHNVEETEEENGEAGETGTALAAAATTITEKSSQLPLQQQTNRSGIASGNVSSGPTGPSAASGSTSTATTSSKNSSGSGTPVRKISAHEFERGGLTKPLVTTVDGAPTFLSPPLPSASGELIGGGQLIRKRSRNDIQGLNEPDLILELVKDICNDLDIKSLCHKILQNVGILTNADR